MRRFGEPSPATSARSRPASPTSPTFPSFYASGDGSIGLQPEGIGWEAAPHEGHLDALKRQTLLGRLGMFEEPGTLEEAMHRFELFLEDPASLHPDLKNVVFTLAARQADRSVYDTLWALEREASLSEEKVRLLSALTVPKRENLLRETLERSLSDEVRPQDAVTVLVGVGSNRYGRDHAWEFIEENWEELTRRYSKAGFLLRALVGVSEGFTTVNRAEEVEAFFRSHPTPAAQRKIQQSLERIRLNAKWLEVNRADLQGWFDTKH